MFANKQVCDLFPVMSRKELRRQIVICKLPSASSAVLLSFHPLAGSDVYLLPIWSIHPAASHGHAEDHAGLRLACLLSGDHHLPWLQGLHQLHQDHSGQQLCGLGHAERDHTGHVLWGRKDASPAEEDPLFRHLALLFQRWGGSHPERGPLPWPHGVRFLLDHPQLGLWEHRAHPQRVSIGAHFCLLRRLGLQPGGEGARRAGHPDHGRIVHVGQVLLHPWGQGQLLRAVGEAGGPPAHAAPVRGALCLSPRVGPAFCRGCLFLVLSHTISLLKMCTENRECCVHLWDLLACLFSPLFCSSHVLLFLSSIILPWFSATYFFLLNNIPWKPTLEIYIPTYLSIHFLSIVIS